MLENIEATLIEKAIKENIADLYINRESLVSKLNEIPLRYFENSEEPFLFTSKVTTPHKHRKGTRFGKDSRSSKFRGVSKNGRRFQVFIMINKKKRYFGVLENEIHSAIIYDKLAIIFHGLKVGF